MEEQNAVRVCTFHIPGSMRGFGARGRVHEWIFHSLTAKVLMTPIDLVARLGQAAHDPQPLAQVTAVLRELSADSAGLLKSLDFFSGRGSDAEQAFYRSPQVSLLKIRFDPGRQTPPHDHGCWAAILLLQGKERNTLYRTDAGAGLVSSGEVTLEPGAVLPMPAEAIHVAECVSDEAAIGLHVYGGDEVTLRRRVWHPHTFQEHTHSEEFYGELANLASGG